MHTHTPHTTHNTTFWGKEAMFSLCDLGHLSASPIEGWVAAPSWSKRWRRKEAKGVRKCGATGTDTWVGLLYGDQIEEFGWYLGCQHPMAVVFQVRDAHLGSQALQVGKNSMSRCSASRGPLSYSWSSRCCAQKLHSDTFLLF